MPARRGLVVALLLAALVVAPAAQASAATHHSPKKGVATWEMPGLKAALKDVGASWYYNWSPSNAGMKGPAGSTFVPMIWGAASVTKANLAAAKKSKVILGFNEPDLAGQANMTVSRALTLWPRLQATGRTLGSPAVAWGVDRSGGWLDRFMKGAKAKHLRVDFITLHWYGSDFSSASVKQLKAYLVAVHKKYKKPIWVTEFSLIRFGAKTTYPSSKQLVAFLQGATTMMDKLAYVKRYAYFGLPAKGYPNGLYRDGDSPTAAGRAYRAAGR
ncbi:glycoside hydrolase family protein [Cellulomonas sp. PhB150]|uniref:glycoside hydrolase family protein n=1 Tax=Cellulomonas sp. PhB150 TaxID=2485188 RepID=UPI000F48191F|nr:glycoside hydrolase family protein [Cellulomonas sp. PhB150]ROS27919.1 putative glycosyl hydrolase [Cellulomonas sp. PhB150]